MADHAADDGENNIFVYTGGQVPQHLKNIITHARIDESITEVDDEAFLHCLILQSVDCHAGVEKIGKAAFKYCSRLRRIKLPGVKKIGLMAFWNCSHLEKVEFVGKKLRSIGAFAFYRCAKLQSFHLPFVMEVERGTFQECVGLTYAAFGDELEQIGESTFNGCTRLRFVTIPLNVIVYYAFDGCTNLESVDHTGSVHKAVSSLHLESWRVEMNAEIHRIKKVLPTSYPEMKTHVIQQWIQSVTRRFDHFKVQHNRLLQEAMTLLELALWKVKLDEKVDSNNDDSLETKLSQP